MTTATATEETEVVYEMIRISPDPCPNCAPLIGKVFSGDDMRGPVKARREACARVPKCQLHAFPTTYRPTVESVEPYVDERVPTLPKWFGLIVILGVIVGVAGAIAFARAKGGA